MNACFVLGLDGQTPEVFEEVWRFVEEACPYDVQITYPTPFPGTPLHESLRRQGRLTHEGDWSRSTLFDINFRPDPMSAEELRAGFFDLSERLYAEDFTRWRRERFREQAAGGRNSGLDPPARLEAPGTRAETSLGPAEKPLDAAAEAPPFSSPASLGGAGARARA